MLRFSADENFNNDIVRGVRRRNPAVDIVRVHDAGLSAKDDPAVLEWAVQSGRIVLTHSEKVTTCFPAQSIPRTVAFFSPNTTVECVG